MRMHSSFDLSVSSQHPAMEAKPKRARKPNFSMEEITMLLEEICTEKYILLSNLTNEVTNKKKAEVWADIARKVSACGVTKRTVEEMRDKWKNIKSDTLKRIEDMKKTGGGPAKKPARERDRLWWRA